MMKKIFLSLSFFFFLNSIQVVWGQNREETLKKRIDSLTYAIKTLSNTLIKCEKELQAKIEKDQMLEFSKGIHLICVRNTILYDKPGGFNPIVKIRENEKVKVIEKLEGGFLKLEKETSHKIGSAKATAFALKKDLKTKTRNKGNARFKHLTEIFGKEKAERIFFG